MAGLFTRGALLLGDRTFGLEVGEQMGFRGYRDWIAYGGLAPTLGEALARNVETCWAHLYGSATELAPRRGHWLWRYRTPELGADFTQHSDHVLPPMIDYVRQYLGPDWRPDWVELNYPRDHEAHLIEERLNAPVRFSEQGVGIAIKVQDLNRERLQATDSTIVLKAQLQSIFDTIGISVSSDIERSAAAVAALRLIDGDVSIEGTADFLHMSVRGLQRRLKKSGSNYRELVDNLRHARAEYLLRRTDMPIIEIAMTLGYEDHSSFTRAFGRWAGVAPRQYREAAQSSGQDRLLSQQALAVSDGAR